MKLGGYAHTKGVTFFCDFFKIRGIQQEGKMEYEVRWILPKRWIRKLETKPFLGGLTTLYYQWVIMDKKVKVMMVVLTLLYMLEGFLPNIAFESSLWGGGNRVWLYGAAIIAIAVCVPTILKLFRYHGAEHKVINCYIRHGHVSYWLVKGESRFNKRCGSNIAGIFIMVYGVLYLLNIDSMIIALIGFLFSIQVAKSLTKTSSKWDKYINLLQWITVLEPKDQEIQEATLVFQKLQEVYGIYQKERSISP